jgi:protocatechuate 3,4-dioxygenase alpha subunit
MPPPLPYLRETPSQTAGPYVHIGLAPEAAGLGLQASGLGRQIAGPEVPGTRIRVEGRVLDGTGLPVRDVLIEVWQADAGGHYAHPDGGGPVAAGFRGWGRVAAHFATGDWAIDTVKPGPTPWRDGRLEAPHLNLWLVARGINIGLATRMYFADEAEANAADPVLGLIDGEARRATLAAAHALREGRSIYRFEIRLQGPGETVFFDP